MLADYSTDPTLYHRCLALLDSCFPGIKSLADNGRAHNAYWDKISTPFVRFEGEELIAHLGLIPFDIILEGKKYLAAAIHGVCTKEGCRRKGYFKNLMLEAMDHIDQHYDFSFLFTDEPHFYEGFGFRVIEEYDFTFECSKKVSNGDFRKLNLENSSDLNLMQEIYANRLPISYRFGIEKGIVIATLNALHQEIFYSQSQGALIVYEVKDNTLFLKDIVSAKPCTLEEILEAIPEAYSKVVLQFSPDVFFKELPAIKATPECCFMLSAGFNLGKKPFRFPEPYRC